MPPVSSIWIPGRRWALAPDHPAGRNPAGGHARERRSRAGRHGPGHQGAGRCGCQERPSSCSGITLSDEGGQGERTRTRRYGTSSACKGDLGKALRKGYLYAGGYALSARACIITRTGRSRLAGIWRHVVRRCPALQGPFLFPTASAGGHRLAWARLVARSACRHLAGGTAHRRLVTVSRAGRSADCCWRRG